jgi:O-antigen/teichoic acid export membrane protein
VIARVRGLWRAGLSSGMYRNRFYALGLAMQKGLPVLLIPIILLIFGRAVFSEYALFYGLVQVCGVIVAFGLPQSLVPLWYRQPDSDRFLFTVLVAMTGGWALLLLPGGLLTLVLAAPQFGQIDALSLVSWLAAFTLIFNLNVVATGVARARGRQRRFFWSVTAGALMLLAPHCICSAGTRCPR